MFCKKKKSCLTCTFCMRNRGYYDNSLLNLNPKTRWSYDERSLNEDERTKFILNDFSLIGNKIRQYIDWNKKYQEAEKAYNEKSTSFKNKYGEMIPISKLQIARLKNNSHFKNTVSNEELEILEIEAPPENVPKYDRLGCWHEQWLEQDLDESELILHRQNLKNKKCDFYFSYNKKGTRTLEACEKQRQEDLETIRFRKSAFIYPLITGLIVWAVTYYLIK